MRVAGRVMDKNYDKVGPDVEVQSKLYSDIYNPEFDCRLEFREPIFNITSMLVVKLAIVARRTIVSFTVTFAILKGSRAFASKRDNR
ncbi:hypothetical protein AC249_AIPGENE28249 [Exaiptasia diaphana]|nr:hypothetical protein AC249_AIPGENE28249 [Exaiptasia diaphana]